MAKVSPSSPFLVKLEEKDGAYVPGKFLTAAEGAAGPDLIDSENAAFRTLVWDKERGIVDPGGTSADHFGAEGMGKWNLEMKAWTPTFPQMKSREPKSVEILLPQRDLPATPEQVSPGARASSSAVCLSREG